MRVDEGGSVDLRHHRNLNIVQLPRGPCECFQEANERLNGLLPDVPNADAKLRGPRHHSGFGVVRISLLMYSARFIKSTCHLGLAIVP